jgi:hypothetical protein
MNILLRWACAIACALLSPAAWAQSEPPVQARGTFIPPSGLAYKDASGNTLIVSTTNPLPVVGGGGGGATGPTRATSTTTPGSTAATANTYQSALASNTSRNGCTIQNTSTSTMRIYVGAVGSANDAGAFQIAAGGSFSCASPGGIVITDAISVASSAAASPYVVVSQ